jgi:integrase
MYLWLAAVTGARRGELCGLQWADIDLDAGVIHIAHSYQARGGQKLRKDTKTHFLAAGVVGGHQQRVLAFQGERGIGTGSGVHHVFRVAAFDPAVLVVVR